MSTKARFLWRGDLDRRRWDEVAAAAPLPYATSWWLDAATNDNWYGLVLDDYRAILPVPVQRALFGIIRAGRAPFSQQAGPYGTLSPGDLATLLSALPRRVIGLDLPLGEATPPSEIPAVFNRRQRTNLLLDLTRPLTNIRAGYSKTLRKKLRRHDGHSLAEAPTTTIVEVYRNSSGRKARLAQKHYRSIERLMAACEAHHAGLRYQLENASGAVLAAGFFPVHNGRIINLFAGSTELGFQRNGMARLLDAVIEKHGGEGNVFDFEGSDIEGVAAFFRAFGAYPAPYPQISR